MRGGPKLAEGRTAEAALAGARGRPAAGTAPAGAWRPSRAAAAPRPHGVGTDRHGAPGPDRVPRTGSGHNAERLLKSAASCREAIKGMVAAIVFVCPWMGIAVLLWMRAQQAKSL